VVEDADLSEPYLKLAPNVTVFDGSELPGDDGHVYLGSLPAGPIMVLEAEAATIYRAALTAPSETMLLADLARKFDLPANVIRTGVMELVEDLVSRGVFQRQGVRGHAVGGA
jgi:hypothetical protein